jgi:hypothetical protein
MSTLLDAGDIQRLDRERMLTEQVPRQLPQEDRSPVEDFDLMLDALAAALERRMA